MSENAKWWAGEASKSLVEVIGAAMNDAVMTDRERFKSNIGPVTKQPLHLPIKSVSVNYGAEAWCYKKQDGIDIHIKLNTGGPRYSELAHVVVTMPEVSMASAPTDSLTDEDIDTGDIDFETPPMEPNRRVEVKTRPGKLPDSEWDL